MKTKQKETNSIQNNNTTKKPIQFNWRRHWKKKVAPLLQHELVQEALDLGMGFYDNDWKRGDAPHELGTFPDSMRPILPGTLAWYRPFHRCHFIAFFSMAIGAFLYPELDWRFLSGDCHTNPIGYGPDGKPAVVMDILLFDTMTAEESIANAQRIAPAIHDQPAQVEMQDLFNRIYAKFARVHVGEIKYSLIEERERETNLSIINSLPRLPELRCDSWKPVFPQSAEPGGIRFCGAGRTQSLAA